MSQLWVNTYKSHEYTTRTEKFIYKTKGHCSYVNYLHYIILGSTMHLVESIHCAYVNYLWPNIHSRVPFGVQSMNVAFNLLFSVTHAWYWSVVSFLLSSSVHVATVRVHTYFTPLYYIWEFPVTQIVRSYCRLYFVMWTVTVMNYLWHVYHSQPL